MPIELQEPLRLNDQVLTRKDWLPAGLFADLDELREEHHRLLDESYAVRDECVALRRQYEAEDEARKEALMVGDEPPPVTGSAERKDALAEADARLQARWDVVAEFVRGVIEIIKQKGGEPPEFAHEPGLVLPEWRQEFAAQRAEADAEVEAARQVLHAAELKEAGIKGNERWLNMAVKAKGGMYLAAAQSPPLLTRAEWDADKVPPSMSGMGMVK